jgi:8-oxo-dGTP pyrophosphatase MutT (NUDIX family)
MAHIHEKIDFTASICIVHDNKVLLHVHKRLGIWLVPGGHVELGEDPNETAIREAKEETGLDIELVGEPFSYGDSPYSTRELIPPQFLNRHFFDLSHTHEHIDLCYFARPITDISKVRPEIEGGAMKWFTKEELERNEQNIVPDVRAHALAALKALAS